VTAMVAWAARAVGKPDEIGNAMDLLGPALIGPNRKQGSHLALIFLGTMPRSGQFYEPLMGHQVFTAI
jgi:hypothetical protein